MSEYISVIFPSPISEDYKGAFTVASQFWNNVITSGGPGKEFDSSFKVPRGCQVKYTFPEGSKVNGLGIFAEVKEIDGNGGILGQAGPCSFVGSFPTLGIMMFDSADAGKLVRQGQFEAVIIHEMGHVVGIGGLWQQNNLVRNACTKSPCNQQPSYVGIGGIEGFKDLGGGDGQLDVSNDRGPGTWNAHWDDDTFDFELMTGFLNSNVKNPLSVISVKSMRDLGYTVNLAASEEYTIPSKFSRPLGGEKLELIGEMLNIEYSDLTQEVEIQKRALGRNQPEDVSGSLTGVLVVMILGFVAMMGFMQYNNTKQRKVLQEMIAGNQITASAPSKKVIEP